MKILNVLTVLFLVGLVVWCIWFYFHTKADRDWNNTVVRDIRDNMPRQGYASQAQRDAANDDPSLESDPDDPNRETVLMQNLTKRKL